MYDKIHYNKKKKKERNLTSHRTLKFIMFSFFLAHLSLIKGAYLLEFLLKPIGKVRLEMETLFAQGSHSQEVVKGHSNSFSLSTHPMHWPNRQLGYTHPVLRGLVGRKMCFVLHFRHHLTRAREVQDIVQMEEMV